MRNISRETKTVEYRLIGGEWEPYRVDSHKEIVAECTTLEDSLSKLAKFKDTAKSNEKYYIGYESVALNLEDWEEAWIHECIANDRFEKSEGYRNKIFDFDTERDELKDIDIYDTYEDYNFTQ